MRSKSSTWQDVLVQIEALPNAERTALFREVENRNGGAVTRNTYDSATETLRIQAAELALLRVELETSSDALYVAQGSKAGPKTTVMRDWLLIYAKARHDRGESYPKMMGSVSKLAKSLKLRGYKEPRSLMNVVNSAKSTIPDFQSKLEAMKANLERDARRKAAVASDGAQHAGKSTPRGEGCSSKSRTARQ